MDNILKSSRYLIDKTDCIEVIKTLGNENNLIFSWLINLKDAGVILIYLRVVINP